jgi:hypothetical protein
MLVRAIFVLALVLACSATSCIKAAAFVVLPNAADSLTTQEAAFALQETVSRQFGLAPYAYPDRSSSSFTACFGHDRVSPGLLLCGKTKGDEVQFLLTETMRGRLTRHADSLRLALFDSLRNRFGDHAVRECVWHQEHGAESGCPLATAETRR